MIGQPEHSERAQATLGDTFLIDRLQQLLEQQLDLVQRGSLAGLDEFGEQADAIVAQIVEAGLLNSPALSSRRWLLDKLYRELYLVLVTQRQETADALSMVRRGKRTIAAYRRNLRRIGTVRE